MSVEAFQTSLIWLELTVVAVTPVGTVGAWVSAVLLPQLNMVPVMETVPSVLNVALYLLFDEPSVRLHPPIIPVVPLFRVHIIIELSVVAHVMDEAVREVIVCVSVPSEGPLSVQNVEFNQFSERRLLGELNV